MTPAHKSPCVLIVDDEANARMALSELLRDEGYQTHVAADGAQGLSVLRESMPDVVLTDLRMPRVDGVEFIQRARTLVPSLPIIVMTAFGTIETAVGAIKAGAENYLTKPLDFEAVRTLVSRAVQRVELEEEAQRLRAQVEASASFENIIGAHPSMQRLMKTVLQVAGSRATVLIEGESGTGKELFAAAIHQHSPRSQAPFVRLNCAALAENLLESELFGHERGAFTGAVARRQGRFDMAAGGTLFLDEVSEISPSVQVKLLRFLQEREFEPVGSNETRKVDVRVVAATNQDLKQCVAEGRFREDLYYRLNVVQLQMPPLRGRRSDIPGLAEHFIRRFSLDNECAAPVLTGEALHALVGYPWPGNVRELENAMERAVVLSASGPIGADLVPSNSTELMGEMGLRLPGVTMAELERMAIQQALEAADGSTAKAASMLGISQRKIQYRLKEWTI